VKIAGIPRSTYYYYIKSYEKSDKYIEIKKKIQGIFDEKKKRVGYRRITLELHNQEICINHKSV